jgi:hypothetical protein
MRFFLFGPRFLGVRPGISVSHRELAAAWGAGQMTTNRVKARAINTPGKIEGSFVYVARCDNNLVKVGVSTNPNARLAQLQTGSAFPLSFAFIGGTDGSDGFAIERETHRILDRCRVNGEWFDCPPEMAIAAVSGAASKLGEKLAPIAQKDVDTVIKLSAMSTAVAPAWASVMPPKRYEPRWPYVLVVVIMCGVGYVLTQELGPDSNTPIIIASGVMLLVARLISKALSR